MSEELRKGSKLLASLALFGIMHKSKKTTYEIIEEFLVEIIKTNKLIKFTTSDINSMLYEHYEFDIVEAVIKTILKKASYLSYKNQVFTVSDDVLLQKFKLNDNENTHIAINNKFIYDLNQYISKKTGEALTDNVKKKIFEAFNDFMLDHNIVNEYSIYVKSFIVDHQNDEQFVSNLQTIKEGVLLYEGLKFDSSQKGIPHNFRLNVYLNIEILFHLVNFDGKVQKLLVEDFISLVRDINKKNKCITLRCLHKTKEEVEYFFNTAERIVNGGEKLNNISNAMAHIVKGCSGTIDVLEKKTLFYKELTKHHILIDEEEDELYSTENHQFSICSADLIEKYKKDESINESAYNEIEKAVDLLNIINIKRKGFRNKCIEKSKTILLSDNYKIRKIGGDDLIIDNSNAPLAVSLQYLTTRFWFKLNKGFGSTDSYPSSFKVIVKAQVLLGNEVKNKINKQYQEFKSKGDSYSEENSMAILTSLKERLNESNEISSKNVDLMIDTLEEDSIDSYAKEHSRIRKNAKKQEEQNKYLLEEVDEKNNIVSNLEDMYTELENKFNKEKEEQFTVLEKKYQKIMKKANFKLLLFKTIYILGIIIMLSFTAYIIKLIKWDVAEPILWFLSVMVPVSLSLIYVFITEKTFNLLTFIENKKSKIVSNLEEDYEFDYSKYTSLKNELKE